jgi:hypothetical protein
LPEERIPTTGAADRVEDPHIRCMLQVQQRENDGQLRANNVGAHTAEPVRRFTPGRSAPLPLAADRLTYVAKTRL